MIYYNLLIPILLLANIWAIYNFFVIKKNAAKNILWHVILYTCAKISLR
jgi:hypothetical protein